MEIPHIRPEDDPAKAPAGEPARRSEHPSRGGPILAVLRHRWPEYLIEIVVIVLSISISFALDQWKESRHEHEVEQLYLRTLSNNLTSDIDALNGAIPETQLVIRKAHRLLAICQGGDLGSESINEDILDIARRPSFFAHDAGFTDLKSSGNLRVLHDFRLKNALFDYYGRYESIKAKEASERESLITLVAPNLLRTVAISEPAEAPGTTSARSATSATSATLAAIRHDRVFANGMWVRIHERGELLDDYQQELRLAESIQKRIERSRRIGAEVR
jgi:hypothetical protein